MSKFTDAEVAQIVSWKEKAFKFSGKIFSAYRGIKFEYNQLFNYIQDNSKNFFIAGGFLPSLVSDGHINDIDIFLTDYTQCAWVRGWAEANPNLLETSTETADYAAFSGISDVAVTLKRVSILYEGKAHRICVQFICPLPGQTSTNGRVVVGDPESVVKTFDMSHCQSYLHTSKMHISPKTFKSINNRLIELNQTTTYDLVQLRKRIEKWKARGWRLSLKSKEWLNSLYGSTSVLWGDGIKYTPGPSTSLSSILGNLGVTKTNVC
jgi:hypothetical protein